MSNKLLFHSSLLCSFIHINTLSFFKCSNILLIILIVIGLFTSIYNHYTTSLFIKILDRIVMYIGFCLNNYFIYKKQIYICFLLLIIAAILYVCAKLTHRQFLSSILHMIAHFTLTFLHIILFKIY